MKRYENKIAKRAWVWFIGNITTTFPDASASIIDLCKKVYSITGEKFWLNVGVLPEKTLIAVKPYLEGIYGAVETVNEEVHAKTAPNKPIKPIEHMYRTCEKLNLKKAMTFIVGMGETIEDFELLKNFIIKNKLDKIVFYALNPIKGTEFENSEGPDTNYYLAWIKLTRTEFPELNIVAGPWVNKSGHLSSILKAGANGFTKFPAIKLFNTDHARTVEQEIKKSGYELQGTFTKMPEINPNDLKNIDNNLKNQIIVKIGEYTEKMNNNF